MALKLYPIGIQTFERIRKEDKLYIDKTEYIYRMAHTNGTYFFLGRPRRFGKSLLVSTMHSYFEGRKELFQGLAMEKLEKEWTEYPVLHFDMSLGKHMEKEQLEDFLGYRLQEEEKKWGIDTPSRGANNRLIDLIYTAYEKNMTTIMPLLYQSGYFTIKDYNRDYNYYTLDVPNKEVKVGLTKALIPSYVTQNTLATTNTARRIAQALDKQDMDGALHLLQDFLGTVPYCNVTNYEGHYQQMLFVIFSLLTSYLVDVEVHTPRGRVDIVLLTQTDLYLIELKLNQSAQAAMQQINLKNYRQRFALSGKPVTKVGVNFDSTQGNITGWVIEE